jgi:folate-binding protein YgfZ
VRFLQGQCTQDVASRAPNEGGYAFVVEPKGRVVSDLRFLVQEDRILLAIPPAGAVPLHDWWARYLLLADASLIDVTGDTDTLLLLGPGRDRSLSAATGRGGELPAEGHRMVDLTIGGTPVSAWTMDDLGLPAARIWCERDTTAAVAGALLASDPHLALVGFDAVDTVRAEAGWPAFGAELDGAVLPAEGGVQDEAVSLTKGCYCGQEVVARQHYLGRPRRRLVGLVADAPLAVSDRVESAEGVPLGRVTTAHRSPTLDRWIGLAVLRGAEHPPGMVYRIIAGAAAEAQGEGRVARVAELPFVGRAATDDGPT